jgi:hypothetical protein
MTFNFTKIGNAEIKGDFGNNTGSTLVNWQNRYRIFEMKERGKILSTVHLVVLVVLYLLPTSFHYLIHDHSGGCNSHHANHHHSHGSCQPIENTDSVLHFTGEISDCCSNTHDHCAICALGSSTCGSLSTTSALYRNDAVDMETTAPQVVLHPCGPVNTDGDRAPPVA